MAESGKPRRGIAPNVVAQDAAKVGKREAYLLMVDVDRPRLPSEASNIL